MFKNFPLYKLPIHKSLQILAFIVYFVFSVAGNYTSYISVKYLLFNMGYALAILAVAVILQTIFLLWPVKYLLKSTWLESLWATLHMASLSFVVVVMPIVLYQQLGAALFLNAAQQLVVTAIGITAADSLYLMIFTTSILGLVLYALGAAFLGIWVLQQYGNKKVATELDRKRAILILFIPQALIALVSCIGIDQYTNGILNYKTELFGIKKDLNQPSQAFTAINQVLMDNTSDRHVNEVIMEFLVRPNNGGLTPTELQELIKIAEQQNKPAVVDRLENFGKVLCKFKQFELKAANKFA